MMSYKKCLAREERERERDRQRERETDRQTDKQTDREREREREIGRERERERKRDSLWIQLSLTPTDIITLVFVFVLRPYEVSLTGLET